MGQLTDTQHNLIVEALLFGACLEITDNWSVADRIEMINIASQFKSENTPINNIQIHSEPRTDTNINSLVISSFPNITVIVHA